MDNSTDETKRKMAITAKDPQYGKVGFHMVSEGEAGRLAPQLTALFGIFKFRNYQMTYMLIILVILMCSNTGYIAFNINQRSIKLK